GKAKIPRLNAPPARNPDRRMRLLQWSGPDVNVPELRILAIKTKGLRARPGLHDETVGFIVLVSQPGRWLAITELGVHRGSYRKSHQQTTTAHDIEHGKFFRHPPRRIVQGDTVTHDHQRRLGRAPRQGRTHEIRGGHEAVGVLMVL